MMLLRPTIQFVAAWTLLSCLFPLSAQEFLYRHYQQSHELTSQFVNSIFQAADGRIWAATRGGVNVYNGIGWQAINRREISTQPTSNIAIERLVKGWDGSIWAIDSNRLGTLNIYRNDRQGWTHIASPKTIAADTSEIWVDGAVVSDRQGRALLALTTNSSSLVCHDDASGWRRHDILSDGAAVTISGIAAYGNSILLSTSRGLYRFENQQLFTADEFNHQLPDLDLLGVAWDGENGDDSSVWVIGRQWIRRFGMQASTQYPYQLPDKHIRYSSVLPDRCGGLYILTHHADKYRQSLLLHFSAASGEIEDMSHHYSLRDRMVQCISNDRENNLWIGTSRGISKLVSRDFKSFRREHGLLEDEVSAIHFLSPDQIIFGHNTGFTEYRNGQFIQHPFHVSQLNQRVLSISDSSDGRVFMACNNLGLLVMNRDGKKRFYKPGPSDKTYINGVCNDPDRQKVWVAGNGGLYSFADSRFRTETPSFLSPNINARSVQRHPNGLITFCTISCGLISFDGSAWRQFTSRVNPQANNVYYSLLHPDYGMLLATSAGLFKIEKDQITPFLLGETSLNELCYSLVTDHQQQLWIGTQSGLLSWDGLRLKSHLSGDGHTGYEINREAMKVDQDGRLWVGSIDGVAVFQNHPHSPFKPAPPGVVITELKTRFNSYAPTLPVQMNYDQNSFSLHFFCPSYINETNNRYRYRLTGFEEQWQEIGNRHSGQISYQNLPAGQYLFEIMAANAYEQWGPISRSAGITVRAPFWKSVPFIVLSALIILLIPVWAVFTYSQKRHANRLEAVVESRTEELKKQKAELERLNTELRQADSTKNKFFSIIAHDLRNPFSSLLTGTEFLIEHYDLLSNDMKKKHTREIHDAAKLTYDLVNNLLDWSRTQIERIEFVPSRIDLTRLIQQILRLFESDTGRKSLQITLLIPPRCDMIGDRHMIRFIIRNLISNAIKFTPRGGHITISVYDHGERWSIGIQDSGMGISPENLETLNSFNIPFSSSGTEGERGTGLGLILCREFIHLHKGGLTISSAELQGSLFTVILPKGDVSVPRSDAILHSNSASRTLLDQPAGAAASSTTTLKR